MPRLRFLYQNMYVCLSCREYEATRRHQTLCSCIEREPHMSYMPRVRCEACHAVCLWKKYLFCYVDEKLNMLIDALIKERQKNITKLPPNCKQNRWSNSNSIVFSAQCYSWKICNSGLFFSWCIRNKFWSNPSKAKYSQNFILDGRFVKIRTYPLKSWFQFAI